MGLKYHIKKFLMLASITKAKNERPFDLIASETYELPSEADKNDLNDYYFSAHTLEGESIVLRKVLGGEGQNEIWFIYHSQKGTYANRITTFNNEEGPLNIILIDPGKVWQFTFKGLLNKMIIDETKLAHFTDEQINVEVSGQFTSENKVFDFKTQLDPEMYASALAKEKWDKSFKVGLKINQQERVKQQGMINAKIKLGEQDINFKACAIRDHAYGRQDLDYVNRHIYLMTIIRKGELLNLSRISHSHVRNIITGYYEKDGRVEQISLKNNTASIPTLGTIPLSFRYRVELKNAIKIDVRTALEVIIPYVLNEGKYVLFVGIASFDANKRMTRGIMEFGFHSDEERWQFQE